MTARTNKYAASCVLCNQTVPAATGDLGKLDGKWIVSHKAGTCPTSRISEAPAAITAGFAPTAEQDVALALYATGQSMVIEAGAGTGKTSTLLLLAKSDPTKTVKYVAFGKDIVKDVGARMPANASASTVHSLAFQAVGKLYADRVKNRTRMSSDRIAAILGVDPIFVGDGDHRRALNPGYLAGQVMKALNQFCQSADPRPTARHFSPIDGIDTIRDDGTRTYDASNMVARALTPALERAWADIQRVDGILPFGHSYCKIWQLNSPVIHADVIMFDEAQDASPLLADIVAQQIAAQRVYVGDSAQAIFGFTGAINAIATMKAEGLATATLTQSFRFGQTIADRANLFLDELNADLRLTGLAAIISTIGAIEAPDAILTRTNACAVEAILTAKADGVVAHLVGKGAETLAFAKAARDLMNTGSTGYGDLACFTSWDEVVTYSQSDALGEDLALNVRLVEKFTVETIIDALTNMPEERDADLIISTAHKSKGREWNSVRIAADFVPQTKPGEEPREPSLDEIRLRYVAVTRAKLSLDCSALDTKKEVAA